MWYASMVTTVKELIEVFERRKNIADKKVGFGYRKEFFSGVSLEYKEVLIDLERIK